MPMSANTPNSQQSLQLVIHAPEYSIHNWQRRSTLLAVSSSLAFDIVFYHPLYVTFDPDLSRPTVLLYVMISSHCDLVHVEAPVSASSCGPPSAC
jgi:hypothetical protein